MSEVNLKEVAVSGMMWNGIQKYSIIIISFVSSIVLARLLTPYDYGCIGMLEIFIAVATILIDGGFGAALLQKKRPTQEDYSTIFYWNMVVSIVFYIILFVSAPFIAKFYNIPILSTVLRVQGLVLFVNALKMIQSNQLRKQFRFKPIAIVVITSSVVTMIVTVFLAYLGFGVWALVTQNLLIAILPMIAFWLITGWTPSFLFSKKSFKELFSFGGFMFLTDIINTTSDNLQGLLIGKVYNPSIMGYYAKAKSTEGLSSNGISMVISSVTLQLYSEVQDDLKTLINIIKRITTSLAYITFPLIISLIFLAKPIFIILYSERWLPSVLFFQILALAGFAICLQSVNLQAIAAIGKSKVMFKWTLIKRIIGIVLLISGLVADGIIGLLVGMVISAWIAYFINAWLVDRHIGYKLIDQFKDLLPIILTTLASIVPALAYRWIFKINMYVDALIMTVVFCTIYMAISKLLKLDAYSYCVDLVPLVLKKIKRK